jgi:hypothetical protein
LDDHGVHVSRISVALLAIVACNSRESALKVSRLSSEPEAIAFSDGATQCIWLTRRVFQTVSTGKGKGTVQGLLAVCDASRFPHVEHRRTGFTAGVLEWPISIGHCSTYEVTRPDLSKNIHGMDSRTREFMFRPEFMWDPLEDSIGDSQRRRAGGRRSDAIADWVQEGWRSDGIAECLVQFEQLATRLPRLTCISWRT